MWLFFSPARCKEVLFQVYNLNAWWIQFWHFISQKRKKKQTVACRSSANWLPGACYWLWWSSHSIFYSRKIKKFRWCPEGFTRLNKGYSHFQGYWFRLVSAGKGECVVWCENIQKKQHCAYCGDAFIYFSVYEIHSLTDPLGEWQRLL